MHPKSMPPNTALQTLHPESILNPLLSLLVLLQYVNTCVPDNLVCNAFSHHSASAGAENVEARSPCETARQCKAVTHQVNEQDAGEDTLSRGADVDFVGCSVGLEEQLLI